MRRKNGAALYRFYQCVEIDALKGEAPRLEGQAHHPQTLSTVVTLSNCHLSCSCRQHGYHFHRPSVWHKSGRGFGVARCSSGKYLRNFPADFRTDDIRFFS